MTTISVRLSDKEKAALKKRGKISEVVKEAITLYLQSEQSKETFRRLKELQKEQKLRTTVQEDVALIREDRNR
jgi:Arc/MetJ-type ribon-helix-helix transcriptional regulator